MNVGNTTNLINIIGWGASGKSVLLTLLDSHPDVLTVPIHDKLADDLCMLSSSGQHVDIRSIRGNLSSKGYYNFEIFSDRGFFEFILSSGKGVLLKIPFNLNFFNFERTWKNNVLHEDELTAKCIVNSIYDAYGKLVDYENKPPCKGVDYKYVASMGRNRESKFETILNEFDGSKLIFVRRDPVSIISARSTRPTPTGFDKTVLNRNFFSQVLRGDFFRIIRLEKKVIALEKKYPDRVFVVDFEKLVMDTERAMTDMAVFLDIDFTDLLIRPTCFGIEIKKDGMEYIGKVNDPDLKTISHFRYLLLRFLVVFSKAIPVIPLLYTKAFDFISSLKRCVAS